MTLDVGTRLGPYEIVAPLGSGGMGHVYKGRDTRLDRTVAIKVIASEATRGQEWRSRFEREARAVAALDHPHICGVFDVGDASGTPFLVMPLLDGETLAARLNRGALPIDHSLKIAREIAAALAAAHDHGIVHRDLKPANIMLTRAGAKLLDFGLAKLNGSSPVSFSTASDVDTGVPETAPGTILGTVHYMAPEQLEGREIDARADIWAFGVVLYEMVSGERPFRGETPASLIGAILKDEPSLAQHLRMTSPTLNRLVTRCLAKAPGERWRSAADLGEALRWIAEGARANDAAAVTPRWRRLLPFAALGATVIAAGALFPGWWAHYRETAPGPVQLSLTLPEGTIFSSPPASVVAPQLAMAPDGRHAAFVATSNDGRPMLWVRPLDAPEAKVLAGTEGATYPFWSFDGRAIGFFAEGKLKTIDRVGGPTRVLSESPLDSRGGSWSPNDTILFAPTATSGLFRIPAGGGQATPATDFDATREENSHRFPSFLPDGEHFLYVTRSARQDNWGLSIGALGSTKGTPLAKGTEWSGQALEPGFLLFSRAGTLMRQPFDLDRRIVTGDPVAIASGIGATTTGYAAFSASANGTLAYAHAMALPGQLQWFDRSGAAGGLVGPADEFLDFELSPDARTVAMSRVVPGSSAADLWLLDLARNVSTQFTFDAQNDASAVWSPDGSRLVFRSNRSGNTNLFEKRFNSTENERVLLDPGGNVVTSDWSIDGKWIVFTRTAIAAGFEIWAWPVDAAAPRLAVKTSRNAMQGRLSPDSRWLAYASDESGDWQVYVQPFPGTGERRQISNNGGSEPRWRRDGKELFYLTKTHLMSVAIPDGNPANALASVPLFETHVPLTGNPYRSNYAVTPDGRRFLVNTRFGNATSAIQIVLNWQALSAR